MSVPYYGDFAEDDTVDIPFNTFTSDDPSASVTITDFVDTDIHIHKDGGLVQRNHSDGITVTINLDGITGNHLVKIDTPDEENNCIANCIKLIEHFIFDRASEKLPKPLEGRQKTLGYALNECPDLFPSKSARDSLKRYYNFTNEYPNIRHIGDDACVIRDLNKSDGLLAISLAVAYSAFLIQNHEDILYGNYVKISRGG